ncbi:hypothetical protein MGG_13716 [Pyricularia oryzae 70-15]|uniref:Uncharacterized protein n=1 Tax=Pyricularia oryzae (strain 70-15 / ATCC MYA-4617 / FGSC 8958) TaxID=242507 RepID=G4MNS8_PYRO7|nr:uncharacterized protein MGG_13716 [Pyricularia oryzae 70-15]EHA56294.1 hypothetical protein MGG_13716 [Pyricularia oryzae 70-15]KAI7911978.1 hypothetical protein M9X92_010271 [Pyricularia oryzae]KAI7922492.1 hypothetical protein M0657_005619 [Pyricularia oryzae]
MPVIPVIDGELLFKRMAADMPEIAHSTLVKRLADMYGVTKSILGEEHTKLDVFGVILGIIFLMGLLYYWGIKKDGAWK